MSRNFQAPGPVLFPPPSSALLGFHRTPGICAADQPHREASRWGDRGSPSPPLCFSVSANIFLNLGCFGDEEGMMDKANRVRYGGAGHLVTRTAVGL